MSVPFCLALLALSSLTAASDPECEELIKPLEDRSRTTGKWIFHAGTSDNKEQLKDLKMLNSSWIELSPLPDSEDMTLRWGDRLKDGKCHYGEANSTFSVNVTQITLSFNSSTHEHIGKNLLTCPDCTLWTDTSVTELKNGETRKSRNLYLFTKSGTLDASHLEVFKKQAACLNFPPDFHFGENTDLCPDVTDAKEEEQ